MIKTVNEEKIKHNFFKSGNGEGSTNSQIVQSYKIWCQAIGGDPDILIIIEVIQYYVISFWTDG